MDTENIFEVGGWRVTSERLASKDGEVGMSTEDTAADDVRFWAGDTNPDTAPFRIRKSGKGTLTGATFESSPGSYPNIKINVNDNDAITVEFAPWQYVGIGSFYGGTPSVHLVNGSGAAEVTMSSGTMTVQTSGNMQIVSSGNTSVITGGKFVLDYTDVTEGASTTLRQELNSKATLGASTSFAGAVFLNGGIPIGTNLATSDGGVVTWGGISVPSHTHSQN
jgi:hypothetical protein